MSSISTKRLICAAHAFLVFMLIMLGLVANPGGIEAEAFLGASAIGMVLVALWTLGSWYKLHGSLFNPYSLVLASSWLFNGGQVLLEVLHLNDSGILGGRFSPETILKTEYLVTLAIAAMHLGALVVNPIAVPQKPHNRVIAARHRDLSWHTRWAGWFLLAVSAGPAVWVFREASSSVLAGGYLSLYQRNMETGLATAPRLLASFLVPAALFLLAGSKGNRTGVLVSAAVIFAYSAEALILGSRAPATTALVAYVWLYSRTVRQVRPVYLLAPALLFTLVLFPLIRVIRDTRGADRTSLESTQDAWSAIDNPAVSALSEVGNSMSTVAHTLDLVPSIRPFDGGASYLYALLSAIPNVAWDVHPTTAHGTLSNWLVRTVEPATAAKGGGLGYSYIAEAYANFGWVGVPIVLFLMGLAAGRLSWLACQRTDPAVLALTAAVLSVAIIFARAETADFVRNTSWYAVAPFLLVRALSGVRR